MNFKKLDILKGKIVIRTKASCNGDRSFMNYPIAIVDVIDDVVYYRNNKKDKVRILSADYNDQHWSEVSEKFINDLWE